MTKFNILTCLISIALASQVAAQSTPLYYPPLVGTTWATTPPDQLGFCPERIDSLYAFLDATHAKSFILLKDGRIVLEKYFDSFTRDSFWYWASAGKSLSAFLVGQAQEEGLVDIQSPTSTYLGAGWTSCTPDQEAQITLWHQLTMTNGLEDNVPEANCTDPACLQFKALAGTRWAYHNAPYHLLHDVIEASSGQTINQFTKSRVLDKTGMKGLWVDHIQYGRARDMARFGLLMLGDGVWNGDTLLHDLDYVRSMRLPSQDLNQSYGYLWWLNGQPSYMLPGIQFVIPNTLVPNAPADMYAALGKNDQKIHVVPSKGWVIVRQGENAGSGILDVPVVFDNLMWAKINELVCTPSSVTPPISEANIVVTPTVTNAVWRVQSALPLTTIEVLDMQGVARKKMMLDNALAADVSAARLSNGVYVLRIGTEDGRWINRKVVVTD